MDEKGLLTEEVKRFKQILEYAFYVDENGDEPKGDVDKLLLDVSEQEEEVTDVEEPDTDAPIEEPAVDVAPEEMVTDTPIEEPAIEEPTMDADPFGSEQPVEDEFAEEPAMGGMEEGEVEVDVTDIVDKTEEAKQETTQVSSKVDDLLSKFGELESKLGAMDGIISKIDDLEKEVVERNPTPVEKLNMRSTESFPYTVKLTDFWEDREGYDIGGEEKEEEEYVLTQDEIESDYSETEIRGSFRNSHKDE